MLSTLYTRWPHIESIALRLSPTLAIRSAQQSHLMGGQRKANIAVKSESSRQLRCQTSIHISKKPSCINAEADADA